MLGKLKNIGTNFVNEARIATQDTMLDIQTTAKSSGYVPYQTGNLKRSITSRVELGKTQITGKIGSNLVYAGIQEYGGTIKPRNGKYLKFKGNNGWVSVKQVTIKGKFYMTRAIKDNMAKFKKRLGKLQIAK